MLVFYFNITDGVNFCEDAAEGLFVPDITDCSKYYVCWTGYPVHRDNGKYDGTDIFLNVVTQGFEVENSVCFTLSSKKELQLTPLPPLCNFYVMSYGGISSILKCMDDLQFNPVTEKCDIAANVNCVRDQCSVYLSSYYFVHLPSKTSCEQYYVCTGGNILEQTCGNGLYFNPHCGCCDNPKNVNCSIDIDATGRTTRTVDIKKPSVTKDITCPKNGVHFYPHDDYSQYYVCFDGHGTIHTCSDGLFFDGMALACRELKNIQKISGISWDS